jgi:hypothetical protein
VKIKNGALVQFSLIFVASAVLGAKAIKLTESTSE